MKKFPSAIVTNLPIEYEGTFLKGIISVVILKKGNNEQRIKSQMLSSFIQSDGIQEQMYSAEPRISLRGSPQISLTKLILYDQHY